MGGHLGESTPLSISKKTLTILVAVLILHGLGVLVFNDGFFLTRVELSEQSDCDRIPSYRSYQNALQTDLGKKRASGKACWTKTKRFNRAIIVVIDALKYEFAEWKTNLHGVPHPYENKLPVVRDLLKRKPFNSFLVPFYADPPTTTLQRLKGLTTGGLPTFLEFKDDFSKDMDITEDNLMDLLSRAGRNLTFMGDDTWMSLYPRQFHRAFPFPSFDVKDLHTVDNGVIKHLKPEIDRKDWDLIIAHFLGVDHVGHRFGPFNPAMKSKLIQMNFVLEDLVKEMDMKDMQDTILLVFGDHGMTDDGNHGGATKDEVGAALFAYSPSPILGTANNIGKVKERQTRDKTDTEVLLETTMELLHGTNGDPGEHPTLAQNGSRPIVQQIDLVPTLALLLGLPIPFGNLGMIIPDLFFSFSNDEADVDGSFNALQRFRMLNEAMEVNVAQVLRYLRSYKEKAGANAGVPVWLLDELDQKVRSAYNTLETKENAFRESDKGIDEIDEMLSLHQKTYKLAREVLEESANEGRKLWTHFNLSFMVFGILLVILGNLPLALVFYNSSRGNLKYNGLLIVSMFLLALQLGGLVSNSYIESESEVCVFLSVTLSGTLAWKNLNTSFNKKVQIACLVIAVCSRMAGELGPTHWDRGHEALPGDSQQAWFWLMCVLPLLSFVILGTMVGKVFNKINEPKKNCTLLPDSHVEAVFLTQIAMGLSFWYCQTLSKEFNESYCLFVLWQARIVYLLGIYGIGYAVYNSLDRVTLLRFFLVPMMLLTGPGSPIIFILMFLQMFAYAYVFVVMDIDVPTRMVAWAITPILYFYASGHGCTIDKIQVASAFVGFLENEWIRAGVMLFLNQFGIHMVFTLSLPVILHQTQINSNNGRGKQQFLNERLNFALSGYSLIFAARGLVTICFVAAQRRHLMVWAIFAPKYVFELLFMLAIDFFVLFTRYSTRFSSVTA